MLRQLQRATPDCLLLSRHVDPSTYLCCLHTAHHSTTQTTSTTATTTCLVITTRAAIAATQTIRAPAPARQPLPPSLTSE